LPQPTPRGRLRAMTSSEAASVKRLVEPSISTGMTPSPTRGDVPPRMESSSGSFAPYAKTLF
jgi:hypothetical protein